VCVHMRVCVCVCVLYVHTLRQSFYEFHCIDTIWENTTELPLIIALALGVQVDVNDVF